MDCCENKNIIKSKSEYICSNCGVIQGYEYVHFNYDDYNLIFNNMIKYKKSCYKKENIYLINVKESILMLFIF